MRGCLQRRVGSPSLHGSVTEKRETESVLWNVRRTAASKTAYARVLRASEEPPKMKRLAGERRRSPQVEVSQRRQHRTDQPAHPGSRREQFPTRWHPTA